MRNLGKQGAVGRIERQGILVISRRKNLVGLKRLESDFAPRLLKEDIKQNLRETKRGEPSISGRPLRTLLKGSLMLVC